MGEILAMFLPVAAFLLTVSPSFAGQRPLELRLGTGLGFSVGEALGGGALSLEHGVVVDRWVEERLSVGGRLAMMHDTFLFFDGVRGVVLESRLRWRLSEGKEGFALGAGLGVGAFWDEEQASLDIGFAQAPLAAIPYGKVLDLDDLYPPLVASLSVAHLRQWRGYARSYALRVESRHLDTVAFLLCGSWGWASRGR